MSTITDLTEIFEYVAPLNAKQIQQIIPHRYPFLLVDGITEITEDSITGYKLLSMGEPVFNGHFPGEPVYPGVMQVETLAQTGACWILNRKENYGKIAYLMAIEEAKFRRPALPGMRLDVSGRITSYRSRFGRFEGEITCEGKPVSSATLTFAFQKADSRSNGTSN